MTTFIKRAKDRAKGVEMPERAVLLEMVPDTTVLRSRIMAAVEEALDRAEAAVHDAPSATEAAKKVRQSRAADATLAAVSASAPIVMSALRARATRKAATRVAPWALRAHPVLLGASVVGGAALGVMAVRRRRTEDAEASKHYELSPDASASLDDQVARMSGEGGDIGGYDVVGATPRKFVRVGERHSSDRSN